MNWKIKKVWYLFDKNEKKGPFDELEVADLISYGKVTKETYAQREDEKEKRKLSEIGEFKDEFFGIKKLEAQTVLLARLF